MKIAAITALLAFGIAGCSIPQSQMEAAPAAESAQLAAPAPLAPQLNPPMAVSAPLPGPSVTETATPKPTSQVASAVVPPWLTLGVTPNLPTRLTRAFAKINDPYYGGMTPVIIPMADYSRQLGPNGGVSVLVTDPMGLPLANAPVTFTTEGNLLTANPYGRGKVTSLEIRSNDAGVATVYVRPPVK